MRFYFINWHIRSCLKDVMDWVQNIVLLFKGFVLAVFWKKRSTLHESKCLNFDFDLNYSVNLKIKLIHSDSSPFFQTENSLFHSTALALCRVYSSRRAYIINPHSSPCICLHAFLRNLTLFVNHMTQRKIIAFFRWDIWDTLILLILEFLSWGFKT